jgi:hypothetical protein
VEVIPDEELPLLLIAHFADGSQVAYYDEAMSADLRNELNAHIARIEFPKIDPWRNILRRHGIQFEAGRYRTYVFPATPAGDTDVKLFSQDDPRVKEFGFEGLAGNVHAIERDGELLSACVSTRENEKCGEAWVYTAPDQRNQGFAQKTVNAWAGSLLDVDKVPFYSHKMENVASANLARKLGLEPVFEEIVITQS